MSANLALDILLVAEDFVPEYQEMGDDIHPLQFLERACDIPAMEARGQAAF